MPQMKKGAMHTMMRGSQNKKNDPVNHPSHYTFGTVEVIDIIEDWALDFHEATVVKYLARAKHKGRELEDLRKGRFYLDRKIKLLEGHAKHLGRRSRYRKAKLEGAKLPAPRLKLDGAK